MSGQINLTFCRNKRRLPLNTMLHNHCNEYLAETFVTLYYSQPLSAKHLKPLQYLSNHSDEAKII
jgi:hypothetical protein